MSLAYRWPRSEESILIEYLKTQPNYWDTKNPDYYNRGRRREVLNNAKKILSDKGFSVDVNSISKKFKNLRTMFTKEHKKAIKSQITNLDNVYEPTWEHYNQLMFLNGTGSLLHTRKSKHIDDISSEDDTVNNSLGTPIKPDEEKRIHHPETNDRKSPGSNSKLRDKSRRKRKSCSSLDSENGPASKIQELSNTEHSFKNNSPPTDDDASAFGCLVAHKLRRLSMINQIKAQADIMAVLQKYVIAELEDH